MLVPVYSFTLHNIVACTPAAIDGAKTHALCIPVYSQKSRRSFSTTPRALKKGGKAARDDKHSAGTSDNGSAESPSDFSALESDIATALERLKADLSKLRAGGRFNPQVLEDLRVQPDKRDNATYKLSELAQVIPKGRTVQLIVGEKDVSSHLRNVYKDVASRADKIPIAHQTRIFRDHGQHALPQSATRSDRSKPAYACVASPTANGRVAAYGGQRGREDWRQDCDSTT